MLLQMLDIVLGQVLDLTLIRISITTVTVCPIQHCFLDAARAACRESSLNYLGNPILVKAYFRPEFIETRNAGYLLRVNAVIEATAASFLGHRHLFARLRS